METPDVIPGEEDPGLVDAVRLWAARHEVVATLGPEAVALACAYAPQAADGHVPSGLLLQRMFGDARFATAHTDGCPGDDSCPWNLVSHMVGRGYGDIDDLFGWSCIHRLITDVTLVRTVENYRAEKIRRALLAGDEAEAARWDDMVPAGCARGDHRWHHWPAGRVTCEHCRTYQA